MIQLGSHGLWSASNHCHTPFSSMDHLKDSSNPRGRAPLPLHIFILCTEVLSALCVKGQVDGSLPRVRVARGCPIINHLLFSDYTIVFAYQSHHVSQLWCKSMLPMKLFSGQRINPKKLAITFSVKMPTEIRTVWKPLDMPVHNENHSTKIRTWLVLLAIWWAGLGLPSWNWLVPLVIQLCRRGQAISIFWRFLFW